MGSLMGAAAVGRADAVEIPIDLLPGSLVNPMEPLANVVRAVPDILPAASRMLSNVLIHFIRLALGIVPESVAGRVCIRSRGGRKSRNEDQ
jgi:hypothetical protein